MEFEINNQFTGAVMFTADIDCAEDAEHGLKVGIAVKWAYDNKVSLRGADLEKADLSEMRLLHIDLRNTYLANAQFDRADLSYADMSHANLQGSYLCKTRLVGTNRGYADLRNTSTDRIDKRGAYLIGATLDSDLY